MTRAKSGNVTGGDRSTDQRLGGIERELENWRVRAVPDPAAPLDAEDVARLVRDCFDSLGIAPGAGESFSVNTVHYYRRKDILDEPDGRTRAARYTMHHVWQAAGARLAGFLGLVTLAEARDRFRDADEPDLRRFVAARVADARGRQASRHAPAPSARPLRASSPTPADSLTTAVSAPTAATAALTATIVPLGGNAMCLFPAAHAALHSPAAARALVKSLAAALGLDS